MNEAELRMVRGRDLITKASTSKDTSGAWNCPWKDLCTLITSLL